MVLVLGSQLHHHLLSGVGGRYTNSVEDRFFLSSGESDTDGNDARFGVAGLHRLRILTVYIQIVLDPRHCACTCRYGALNVLAFCLPRYHNSRG